MSDNPEKIQRQIDETKASLVGKLEALETQVADAVQSTTETVSETAEAVKETVETVKEKVHNAGQFLNLKRQAERNPWAVVGCAVAAGCLASYLLGGSSRRESGRRSRRDEAPREEEAGPFGAAVSRPEIAERSEPEPAKEEKHSWFRDQLSALSGLAVGSLMGVVRDLAAQNMPEGLGKSISQEVDRFTTRLGVKPISGPVMPPPKQPAA